MNMPVQEVYDLREWDPEEYRLFEASGGIRLFRDERIFQGHGFFFANVLWKVFIGSTKDTIYRIAVQSIFADVKDADRTFASVAEFLHAVMGEADGKEREAERFWNGPEGNVILEKVCWGQNHFVQLCLTSSIIGAQARKTAETIFNLHGKGRESFTA